MKFWDSVRKQIEYYRQHYGHIFHPVKDFNELLSMFEQVGKINPEDGFETLNTWKLIEDYENRFVFSCKPKTEGMLIGDIIMKYVAGKVLVDRCDGRYVFYEIPKVKVPKEKVEAVETPEVKAEEKEIFINDIFIPSDYLTIYVDPNHVNSIAKSMKEIGQKDPIFVVPIEYVKDIEKKYGAEVKKKYKYILIRGLHRIEAKKLLNSFYIRARVIYNDYEKERRQSFVENVKHHKASIYEQSLEFDRLSKLGISEREIAKEWDVNPSYINKVKKFAKFKKDFGEKHYVLKILTYGALEKLYMISLDPDPRQYNFMKEKIIKAFESGVRKIKSKHIFEWSAEFRKPIEEKDKEIQKRLYGEEITAIEKPIENQQIQLQVQKPISRIPTQEEVKEKAKEVKRKKKEKTPKEKFNKKIESYRYFYGEEFDSMNAILIKYMKEHNIPFERVQKLQAYYRECNREAWKFSQGKLSKEEKEELNRRFYDIADKFFKGELK